MPPGIKKEWDQNNWWAKCQLLGYDQIREHEEFEIMKAQSGIK